MDVEGCTTAPFDLDNHFLLIQSDQRADSRMVCPCAFGGEGKTGMKSAHEAFTYHYQ